MNDRQCSACTACCEGWLISDVMELAPGKSCKHCTAQGCAIYESRPEDPCRKFRCGWLAESDTVPEHMRPDRCGAIVMLDQKWHGFTVVRAVPTGDRIPEETMEWLMAYTRETKIPLLFQENLVENGKYTMIRNRGYGPPGFVAYVKTLIGSEDIMTF